MSSAVELIEKPAVLKQLMRTGKATWRTETGIWHVQFNPKVRFGHDWDWRHDDYDGAPDSGDKRCGTASSAIDAIWQINEFKSPPEELPQGVTVFGLVRDTLGLVLMIGIPVLLVTLFASHMGLFE